MAAGDITVFGLVSGIHLIEDIRVGVAHGCTVTIPVEKAQKSKDLWRALGQKCICLIQSGPYANRSVNVANELQFMGPTQASADRSVQDRQQALEEENRQLRETLAKQRQDAQEAEGRQQAKLDSILDLLRSGALNAPAPQVQYIQMPLGQQPRVVDDAPTFIPTTIRPEHAETRIEAKKTESDSTLSGASDKLRELRRKAKP